MNFYCFLIDRFAVMFSRNICKSHIGSLNRNYVIFRRNIAASERKKIEEGENTADEIGGKKTPPLNILLANSVRNFYWPIFKYSERA